MQKYDKDKGLIWCPICNAWKDLHTQVYLLNNEVRCLEDDWDDKHGALLGYSEEMKEVFHNEVENG